MNIDDQTRQKALKSFLKNTGFDNADSKNELAMSRALQEHCDNRKETALKKRDKKIK